MLSGLCRNVAERSYPTSKVRGSGPKSNPTSRSGGCAGSGGLRGATPHSRSAGVAMRRYPLSKVRAAAALCWSSREEIPHDQGKRNPSKMVGVVREHQRADTLKS